MSVASESGARGSNDAIVTEMSVSQLAMNNSVFNLLLKVRKVSVERVFICREFQTVGL